MIQPLSCGFLIVRGNPIESFLLMKHPRRWDLPKGHVDEGETELQCALRELYEETGISADDIEIDPTFSYENRYMVNQKRYGGKGFVEKKLLVYLAWLKKSGQDQGHRARRISLVQLESTAPYSGSDDRFAAGDS